MSVESVTRHLSSFGLADRIRTFDVSSATVDLAAAALGCDPARIAKTLSYSVNGTPVLVVAAGDVRVDNRKFKTQFGVRARMIPPDRVESLVGHGVGGVCPFALNNGVRVYLDRSLGRFDEVYPAAGSGSSAVRLTIEELERASGCQAWIDVCTDPVVRRNES